MTSRRRDTAPNSGRGRGWDGLLATIRKSEVRHPPTDDGGIDADHCAMCREAFHEHRVESARWRREQEARHDPDWPGWEARLEAIRRERREAS